MMHHRITGIATESNLQKTTKIQDFFEESKIDEKFTQIYSAIEALILSQKIPRTAEHVFPIIHAVLVDQKYQYVKNKAVAHGLLKMEMDCNILTGIYMDLCQKLGVKIQAGYYPGHVFVIGENSKGEEYWWEATSGFHSTIETYSKKKETYGRLTPELLAQGYPLKISLNQFQWTHDVEMAGLLELNGNLTEAIDFYEKALASEARNFESLANLCQIYSILGARNNDLEALIKAKTQVGLALEIQKNEHLLECQKTIETNILKLQSLQIDSIESINGVWQLESILGTKTAKIKDRDTISLDFEMKDTSSGKTFKLSIQNDTFDSKTGKSKLIIEIKSFVGKLLAHKENEEAIALLKKLNWFGNAHLWQQALAGMEDNVGEENPYGMRLMPKLILLAVHLGITELTTPVKDTGIYHIQLLKDGTWQGYFSPDQKFLNKNKLTLTANSVWRSSFIFRNQFLYTPIGDWNAERLKRLNPELNSDSTPEQILSTLNKRLKIRESFPPVFQILNDENQKKSLLFSVLSTTIEHEKIYSQLIAQSADKEEGIFFDPAIDLSSILNLSGGTLVSYSRMHIDAHKAFQIVQSAQSIEESSKKNIRKEDLLTKKIVHMDFDGETPLSLKPNVDSPSGGYLVQIDRPKNPNQLDLPPFSIKIPPMTYESEKNTLSKSDPSVQQSNTAKNSSSPKNEIEKMKLVPLIEPLDKKIRDWDQEEKSIGLIAQAQKKLKPVADFFKNIPGNIIDFFTDHKDPIGSIYKHVPVEPQHICVETLPENIETNSDFFIQQTQVTEEQFRQVMKNLKGTDINPSSTQYGSSNYKYKIKVIDRPGYIAMVSWYDAVEYCRQLSLQDSDLPAAVKTEISAMDLTQYQEFAYKNRTHEIYGKLYRMASYQEWMHAATAGKDKKFLYRHLFEWNNNSEVLSIKDAGANEWDLFMQDSFDEWTGTSNGRWLSNHDGSKAFLDTARNGNYPHSSSKTLHCAFRPLRNKK